VNGSINENQTVIVFICDQLLLDICFDIVCYLLDIFCRIQAAVYEVIVKMCLCAY